jgi:DNA (cytosine-5)-methyltransferase 1
MSVIKCIDLFCGIGGFRIAAERAFAKHNIMLETVLASDIDPDSQKMYYDNFGELPLGDIRKIEVKNIPDHDILFAGFPCQPFSIIGKRKGFEDMRGTLFFEIVRILKGKKPKGFVLENVKQLVGHDGGKTIGRIVEALEKLGYETSYKILNALDYGLPQKRERVIIVGHRTGNVFEWPEKAERKKPLKEIIEKRVDRKYFASEYIRDKRMKRHRPSGKLTIWHENKSGHISSYEYSCALRAGASYNYLLVNGERRLTPREMLRLQGFPETFKITVGDGVIRKQAGNAVPVNLVEAVIDKIPPFLISERKRNKWEEMAVLV